MDVTEKGPDGVGGRRSVVPGSTGMAVFQVGDSPQGQMLLGPRNVKAVTI